MDLDICGENKNAIILNKCMKKQINRKREREKEREKRNSSMETPKIIWYDYIFQFYVGSHLKIIETEKKIRLDRISPSDPLSSTSRAERLPKNVLSCMCWDVTEKFHWEIVLLNQTINADFYCQQLDRLHSNLVAEWSVKASFMLVMLRKLPSKTCLTRYRQNFTVIGFLSYQKDGKSSKIAMRNMYKHSKGSQPKMSWTANSRLGSTCEAPFRGCSSSPLSTRPVSVGNKEESCKSFILIYVY
ncbi:hypothetical protein TNCV_191491 [Trichonephila clavipes]|nr:hypothetical protein TNCV_191491 [Trichonephila clavipes]